MAKKAKAVKVITFAELCGLIQPPPPPPDKGVLITNLTPAARGGDVTVNEDDLGAGTDAAKESATQVGTFRIRAPDGVDDLKVGGHFVIVNGVFKASSFTTKLGNTLKFISFNADTGVVTYSYKLNAAEKHATGGGENSLFEKFAVSLTDKDGDKTTASLDVRVIDDVPVALQGVSSGTVDEDALPFGQEGGPGDEGIFGTKASGDVAPLFKSGADTPLTFSLINDTGYLAKQLITYSGLPLSYTIVGNTITAKDFSNAVVFTFKLESDGDWDFELLGRVDQPGSFDEQTIDVHFGGLIRATDADGDATKAIGSVFVRVDDDVFSEVSSSRPPPHDFFGL